HAIPAADGAGLVPLNVQRDPFHTGNVGRMIQRNTTALFGSGALQKLAEEMTDALQASRDRLGSAVRRNHLPATTQLRAKGVNFGALTCSPDPNVPDGVTFDNTAVVGVDADLVVKPYQWKGSVRSLREFNRGATNNEVGMQAVELVGDGV